MILFVLVRRRIGGMQPDFGSWIARVMLATAVMAMIAEIVRPKLEQATASDSTNRFMHLVMLAYVLAMLTATYFLAAIWLRIPEAERFLSALERRLPIRLRR